MHYWVIALVAVIALVLGFLFLATDRSGNFDVRGKHVVITGGSSGIGKSLATLLVKDGALVTIIARDPKRLEEATVIIREEAMKQGATNPQVQYISADVSDLVKLQSSLQSACAKFGTSFIDVLVTSAGASRPGRFDDVPVSEFERLMRVNYLGTVYSIKAALPLMRSKGGRILMVGSMAGFSGISGFSCYTPTKFALRGLAESLHMEFRPYNIKVSLVAPPDVDTPMLREEMQYKPKECQLISEGSGLFTAEQVAADIASAIRQWRFFVTTGFDGFMLGLGVSGMAPCPSPSRALLEAASAGLLRLVSLGYLWHFNRIRTKVHSDELKLRVETVRKTD